MQMRRIFAVVGLIAAMVPAPAGAQSAGGYAVEYVEANADWVAARGKGSSIFGFVSVWRDANPIGATDTLAQIGRVECSSRDDRSTFLYSCNVRARLITLRTAEFQFDGALRSARVSFRALGRINHVSWAGKDRRPDPDYRVEGGERALIATASLRVPAKVRGRVLGERFSTTRKKAHAALRRGVEAGAIFDTGPTTFTVRGDSRIEAWRSLRDAIAEL